LMRCERPLLQALRGLLPLFAGASILLGLRLMSLADATVITFAAPLFVVVLSAPSCASGWERRPGLAWAWASSVF
jgi:drug/metabolite transporter (DMT)-like permease